MAKRAQMLLTAALLVVFAGAGAVALEQVATAPADQTTAPETRAGETARSGDSPPAVPSGTEEQVFVHYVEIELLATDRKGNPITDLTADELVVKENGRKQRIASLVRHESEQTEAVPVPEGTIRLRAADGGVARQAHGVEPRWLVFLFDLDNTEPQQFHELHAAARKFVESSTRASDRIAVAALDGDLILKQNFTDDRGQVFAAIDKVFADALPNIRWESRMRELIMLIEDCQKGMVANKSFLAGRECVAYHARNYVQESRRQTLGYIASLEQMSRMLAGVQGRKYVFLMSHGVSLDPTMETIEAIRGIAGSNQQVSELRFQLSEGADYRRDLYRALNQAIAGKVTLIALDPTVPPSSDRGAASSREYRYGAEPFRVAFRGSRDGLDEIAGSTGGRFYGSRQLLTDMQKAMDAIRGGYTLGYYSDRRYLDDPSELIKTSVKAKRRGVRISTRKGYFIEPVQDERKLASIEIGDKRAGEDRAIYPFEVTIDPASMKPLVGEEEVALNYSIHLILRTTEGAPVAESFHFLGHVYPRSAWDQNNVEPPRQAGELALEAGDFVFTMIVRDPALGVTYESSREIKVSGGAPAESQG